MQQQKILVIGFVWPEPSSSAAGYQTLSMLRIYREMGFEVTFSSPAQLSEHMINLADEGVTQQQIVLNCDSFDEYIKQYQPDIVHFDRFLMEEQFGWRVDQHCPSALKILDTIDLQCLRGARQRAHQKQQPFNSKDLLTDELAKREIAAIYRCDLSLIISKFERQLLIDTFKVSNHLLHYLPFMVESESLLNQTFPFQDRLHFMTIGNFKHAPNWDAVLYLQSIWPNIRQQLPAAELHIYGAYPPPKALALNKPETGFLVKGRADSVYDVMQRARVCLAPLRFGAGLKGKLLDAMIMQTPSVTTSIGAEGMSLTATQWPGMVTDDPKSFVDAAVTLYQDESAWQAASERTSQHLKENFNAQVHKLHFKQKVTNVLGNLSQHRQDNFTGAMLKHHTLASTKYLSKWIMAKQQTN